jgi:diguanylate cyclase (GGDEF)-like protein/PAS domain S-box-containing protein
MDKKLKLKIGKFKVYTTLALLYILIVLSFAYMFISFYEEDKEKYLQESLEKRVVEYNHSLDQLNLFVLKKLIDFAQKPKILSIMREVSEKLQNEEELLSLRKKLYKEVEPFYRELTSSGIDNLHFHTADLKSFIRFHKPDKFGDDLSKKRVSLVFAKESGKVIQGYELGKVLNAYRNILPIFNIDNYIGSLEVSYRETFILDKLKKESNSNYIFLVSKGGIEKQMWRDERIDYISTSLSDNFLYLVNEVNTSSNLNFEQISLQIKNSVAKDLIDFKPFIKSFRNYRGDLVQISFIPVENVSGVKIAYVVNYKIDKELEKINNLYIFSFVSLILLILVIFIFFAYRTLKMKELVLRNKYFDTVFNTQENIIVLTEGNFLSSANDSFFKFLGYSDLNSFHKEHECICEFFKIVDKPDYIYKDKDGKNWLQTILENPEISFKGVIEKEGKSFTFSIRATYMHFDEEERSLVSFTDISELINHHNALEDKIRERTRDLNRYVNLVDENIIISSTDIRGYITYASEAFSRISGYKKNELIGKKHSIIRHPENPPLIYEEMWKTIKKGNVWRGEVRNLGLKGDYWVDANIYPNFNSNGEIIGYTAIRQNITDRKIVEELSITDALTSLYNRRHFNKVLEDELNRIKRDKISFSFILMDIDNFKKYNDNYGHQQGDVVLKSVASVFKASLKCQSSYVFRLGGEEFGAILTGQTFEEAKSLVEFVCKEIEKVGIVHEFNTDYGVVTGSFGFSFAEILNDEVTGDDFYRLADEALYRAKESGRNRVEAVKI